MISENTHNTYTYSATKSKVLIQVLEETLHNNLPLYIDLCINA